MMRTLFVTVVPLLMSLLIQAEENRTAEFLVLLKIPVRKMECKVCLHPYDQTQRRPRVLPCGHTFCDKCVQHLLAAGSLTCPNCRGKYKASSHSQFPFAFELEELLLSMQESSIAKPQKSASEELGPKMTSLVNQQMSSVSKITSDIKKLLHQLQKYEAHADMLVIEQEDCLAKFADMVEQQKSLLICQRKNASLLREKGQEHEQQLKAAMESLDTTSSAEVAYAFTRTEKVVAKVQEWAELSQKTLLDVSAFNKSIKAHAGMVEGLEMIGQELKDATDLLLNYPKDTDKCDVQKIMKTASIAVTMKSLWEMAAPVKCLVEAGQLVAVQQKKKQARYAKITTDGDEIYLHRLQKVRPREELTHTLPFHRLRDRANTDTLTFLDLSWIHSPPRRVYIRVKPEDNKDLAEQFVFMCSAEKGPSFAGTHLSKSEDKPFILGGDYDNDGGTAIVSNIDRRKKSVLCLEGMVSGYWLYKQDPGTRFTITIEDYSNCIKCSIFGDVVEGIEVLKQAPTTSPIKVVDCGIVVKEKDD